LILENIPNSRISFEKSTPLTTLIALQTKKGCGKKDIDSSKVNFMHTTKISNTLSPLTTLS
jgi:hypothetical protein